jgi:hypothetical protein
VLRLEVADKEQEQDRYNDTEYHHYNIAVDAFTSPSYNQSTPINSSSTTAIVDSGSIAIAAPPAVVAAYSALFSPPAYFVPDIGIYVTTCDARGPIEPFHVVISTSISESSELKGEQVLI